jgi:hypothetical protein
MMSVIHDICHIDSQDLARPIFHLHVVTSSVFGINSVADVGGQTHSVIGATACTDCSR